VPSAINSLRWQPKIQKAPRSPCTRAAPPRDSCLSCLARAQALRAGPFARAPDAFPAEHYSLDKYLWAQGILLSASPSHTLCALSGCDVVQHSKLSFWCTENWACCRGDVEQECAQYLLHETPPPGAKNWVIGACTGEYLQYLQILECSLSQYSEQYLQ
jgi:hypothetical protein